MAFIFYDGRSIPYSFRQIVLQNLVIEDLPLMELMDNGREIEDSRDKDLTYNLLNVNQKVSKDD